MISPENFSVKRIHKVISSYARVSINNSVENNIIILCKSELKKVTGEFRKKDRLSCMSLNENSLSKKLVEEVELLKRYKTDVICLQETRHTNNVWIPGYMTFEIKSNEKSSELVLMVNINRKTTICFTKLLNDLIVGVINNQITICNVYNPHDKDGSREIIQQVSNSLNKKSNCFSLEDLKLYIHHPQL